MMRNILTSLIFTSITFMSIAVPLIAVPLIAVPLIAVPLIAVPLIAAPLFFLSGWVWSIQPDNELYDIKASAFIYSDHGICAINANQGSSVLNITHCGNPIAVSDGCYSEPSFTVCTATATLEDRSTTPCRQSMVQPVCLYTPFGDIYYDHLNSPDFFTVMELQHIFCPGQLSYLLSSISGLFGFCLYNQAYCHFLAQRYTFEIENNWEEIQCDSCSTAFNKESGYTYYSDNKTLHPPFQGCPVQKEVAPFKYPDIDSVESALSSWVFFVAVNEYNTGNTHEESENLFPGISAPMACNGAQVHENYLLTSNHCGKKLQKVLEEPALIKIFKVGNEQAIGYITHSSFFHFSNDLRELGAGSASLISFESIASTLPSPEIQFPKISSHPTDLYYDLYLIASSPGNFSVKSCNILMESEHADLHKVSHMELPSWLSNGEPAFQQRGNHLELVGWVNLLNNRCSNNMNENCITPVTASLLPWIDKVFSQALNNNDAPTIITSGCLHVTTSDPENHSDSSHLIRDILIPIGSGIVGVVISVALTACICHFSHKRKSAFQMQRFSDTY